MNEWLGVRYGIKTVPSFTTLRYPPRSVGQLKVEMLINRLRRYIKCSRNFSNKSSLNEQVTEFLKETSSIPSSRSSRLFQLGGLAASLGIGVAGQFLKGFSLKNGPIQSYLLNKENIERIVRTLTRMRGAALKLGQMISMQDSELFPPEIEQIFAKVRDGANHMPLYQLSSVMNKEFGANWKERFIDFNVIPFAAASIGQVHLATIPDKTVAVKVQYPGIASSIISDLDNLKSLLLFSQILPKGLYLENSIKVAQRELLWECDYRREALFMKKFKEQLEGRDEFFIPKVIEDLSTERILTTEYVEGVPLNSLQDASQEVRDRVCKLVLELCLYETFVMRSMQTDPNWSNFLYNFSTDQIVLLDFGSARDFDVSFINNYAQIILAAADQDSSKVREWSIKLGFLTGDETNQMINAHTEAVLALGKPFSVNGLYDFSQANEEVTSRVKKLIPTMISHRLTPPPDESYSLHRKLSGIFLLCTRLKARIDCQRLLQDILVSCKIENYKK